MASSEDTGRNIRTHACPKMGHDQVSGGESVPVTVGIPHPMQMFCGNLFVIST